VSVTSLDQEGWLCFFISHKHCSLTLTVKSSFHLLSIRNPSPPFRINFVKELHNKIGFFNAIPSPKKVVKYFFSSPPFSSPHRGRKGGCLKEFKKKDGACAFSISNAPKVNHCHDQFLITVIINIFHLVISNIPIDFSGLPKGGEVAIFPD
jgi:hypothetical protein